MSGLLLVASICGDLRPLLGLIGKVLTIFKIAIPLIIIILGIIDLGKAAISAKPEEVKKCTTSLFWRLIGGVVIFFLPSIIMLVFGLVDDFKGAKSEVDFDVCQTCITHWGC